MTTITLPPEIEAPLAEAARKKGTTTELLALESLRQLFPPESRGAAPPEGATNLLEYLGDFVGSLQGTGESFSQDCGERFTDYLVEKKKAGRL
jgi:hypothetical protein